MENPLKKRGDFSSGGISYRVAQTLIPLERFALTLINGILLFGETRMQLTAGGWIMF